jgi:hypothetical protein
MSHNRARRVIGLLSGALAVAGIGWFAGLPAYDRWKGRADLVTSIDSLPECQFKWENVRRLPPVLRPGTMEKEGIWFTPVAYELVYPEGHRDSYLALYDGKSVKLESCADKQNGRYGNAVKVEADFPPVAMVMSGGSFYLETADDTKRGVPLERLPLISGKLPPGVSTQR